MTPQVGDLIADCVLTRPDGTLVRLSEWGGRPQVVIFLRHLA